jgi:hypothetical protein
MSVGARKLRSHLTYANATATLALFIAISGAGAYAANQLAPKSVGAPELRPGAVTAAKLRKNAVVTPKIKANAVTAPKLADGAANGRILAPDSVTSDKIAFQAITNEKVGPDAITGAQIVESSLSQVPSANAASNATTADSAQPVAFAEVTGAGSLVAGLDKGVSAASKASTGVYCITVAGFNPRGAQVTPRSTNDSSGVVFANVTVGGTGACPGLRVEVQTFDRLGARADARFYVVFYR